MTLFQSIAATARFWTAPILATFGALLAPSNNSPNAPTISPNQTTTLRAYGSFSVYEWFVGNSKIGVGSSIAVSPAATTVYICKGKTAGGCVVESSKFFTHMIY